VSDGESYSRTVAPRYHHIKILASPPRPETTEDTIRALFGAPSIRGDILDLGCGDGRLLLGLGESSAIASLTGIDMDPAAIRAACARAPQGFRELHVGNVAECTFPSGSFDAVLLDPTFLLYFDAVHILDRVYAWLRPRGTLVLYSAREGESEFRAFLRMYDLTPYARWSGNVATCFIEHEELSQLRSQDHFAALCAAAVMPFVNVHTVEEVRTLVGRAVLRSGRRRMTFPVLPPSVQRFLSLLPLTYAPVRGEVAEWSLSDDFGQSLPPEAHSHPRAFFESLPYVDRGLSFAPRLIEGYPFSRFHHDGYDLSAVRSFRSDAGAWFTIKRRRGASTSMDLRDEGIPLPRNHGEVRVGRDHYVITDEWRTHVTWATARRWADLFGMDAHAIDDRLTASVARYEASLVRVGASPDAVAPRNVLVRWDYASNAPDCNDIGFIDLFRN